MHRFAAKSFILKLPSCIRGFDSLACSTTTAALQHPSSQRQHRPVRRSDLSLMRCSRQTGMSSRKRIVTSAVAHRTRDRRLHKLMGARPILIERHEVARRGLRQIGSLPGARLGVAAPRSINSRGEASGRRRTFFRTRQSLAISASDDLRRLRRRARCRAHSGWATVALGRGRHHEFETSVSRVNGAGRAFMFTQA